jgi:cytoskeletal protein CcmA (bactofilin family)
MKWLKAIISIAVLLLILGLSFYPALAFEGRGGEKVVIEEGETVEDDLFVSAREFILKGRVKGDLAVLAQNVRIEKTAVVEGDLYAAGQTVEVEGKVKGDIYASGQTIKLGGEVDDDIIAAGYALSVAGKAGGDFIGAGFSVDLPGSLGKDFLFFGYQALLAGDVGRNARFAGNGIKISGRVGGNVEVDVSEAEEGGLPPGFPFYSGLPTVPIVPPGLTLEEGARIGGELRYTAKEEARIPAGVVGGEVKFKKYERPKKVAPPLRVRAMRWGLERLRYLVSLFIVGAVMLLAVPSWTRRMADSVKAKPLPSLGWGVVVLVAFAFLILVVGIITVAVSLFLRLLTLSGLARWSFLTGFMAGAAGFLSLGLSWVYITRVLASIAIGVAILQAFRSQAASGRWWPFVLGVVVLVLVTSIPILGRLISWLASLAGLGSFWLLVRGKPAEAPTAAA